MIQRRPAAEHPERTPTVFDPESAAWLDELRAGAAVRERALARLHDLLLGVARAEAFRWRSSLPDTVIADFDSLCMQAADDALAAITDKLDAFRGDSRFTTWAYKFAILAISMRLRRSAWHERRIVLDDAAWERLSDPAADPQQRFEQQELLAALRSAVANALTRRQRDVFLAVAVEESADRRSRRTLGHVARSHLQGAARCVAEAPSDPRGGRPRSERRMSDERLRKWLGNARRDLGCEAGFEVIHRYAEALLRGENVEPAFPEVVAHLENCTACREDVEGLLAALRQT